MAIHEYSTTAPLIELMPMISAHVTDWGFAVLKRQYLRPMTNEAFLLALRPVLENSNEAHIAFQNDQSVFVAWNGKQKVIYKLLRNLVSASLMMPTVSVDASVLANYIDPSQKMDQIKSILSTSLPEVKREENLDIFGDDVDEDVSDSEEALQVLPEQSKIFLEFSSQKHYRKQLHILVVEDEPFSQKILLEILRGVRVRNNNESPQIDTTQSVREAWKGFLKKAPDIVFVDLNLTDGSGHSLVRAIKELDPHTHVIIVTGNDFEEEINVARQNNADGFITKPYNKKQILDGITKYVEANKPVKGVRRASYY